VFRVRSTLYRRRMQHDVDQRGERTGAEPSGGFAADDRLEGTMSRRSFRFVASSLAVLPFAAACSLRTSVPPKAAELAERVTHLAVPFVANAGQSDPRVAYYAPTPSGTVFVTGAGDLVYALPHRAQTADAREPASGGTLTESFVDGHPTPVGAHPAATHVSV